LAVGWWLRRPARPSDPWMRVWQRICQRLERAGAPARAASEGPLAYAGRVAAARPDLSGPVERLAALYANGRYGTSGALDEFRQAARALQIRRRP
jgi:hypothetical protein